MRFAKSANKKTVPKLVLMRSFVPGPSAMGKIASNLRLDDEMVQSGFFGPVKSLLVFSTAKSALPSKRAILIQGATGGASVSNCRESYGNTTS